MEPILSPKQPLPGPALTAVGVAMIRARETARTDRLYTDPFAQKLVDAVARRHTGASVSDAAAETWRMVGSLAEVTYDSRTIGVRVVDDFLLEAVDAGCTQVVLLGAGLDTQACRLEWPRPVQLFEVDLPELFEFKEEVLADARPHPHCARRILAAALALDWSESLSAAGFRAGVQACWVDHVSVSLQRTRARQIVEQITELSCAGSRYSIPVMSDTAIAQTAGSVPGAVELYRGAGPDAEQRGLGAGGLHLLERLGWTVIGRGTDRGRPIPRT